MRYAASIYEKQNADGPRMLFFRRETESYGNTFLRGQDGIGTGSLPMSGRCLAKTVIFETQEMEMLPK